MAKIILGIGASIAAYKSLELIRLLQKQGMPVQAIPTRRALDFVTQLSLDVLSHSNPKQLSLPPTETIENCHSGLDPESMNLAPMLDSRFRGNDGSKSLIEHIESAYAADALLVAPATADLIAKMAHGFADEVLLQTYLSFQGPVLVAPAMETHMWEHPATQANVALLQQRGVKFISPEAGALASGREGFGRLAELETIVDFVCQALSPQDFFNRQVLLTAGPTLEPIDPVRCLTNHSSGRMGVALARELACRGAQVHVVHGPLEVQLPNLSNVKAYPVQTANQMFRQVMEISPHIDMAICCAAVADYRLEQMALNKVKKSEGFLENAHWIKNPDILKSLGELQRRPFLVGFAAETENLMENALDKCRRKNCDLLCANWINEDNPAFGQEQNALMIVNQSGLVRELLKMTKTQAAREVVDLISNSPHRHCNDDSET